MGRDCRLDGAGSRSGARGEAGRQRAGDRVTIALQRIELARTALQFESRRYCMVKDPCPVFDGSLWHLFGTGITSPHVFELLHATAPTLRGPWQVGQPIRVAIPGGCVAAPGV